jgi:Dolichyl-phosphate-mannose-protein mannosyltransferase
VNDRTTLRLHRVVVALLVLVAVVRGGYWALTFEVPSPADEAQHLCYVESLAEGDGIPTVGHDRLSDGVMALTKASPTYFARSRPYTSLASDDNWGAAAQQYEAIHGPTYYALMVPAYLIGRSSSELSAFYAVRLASVLLAAAAIPLGWALARRLFPDRPLAWLLGPGLLVAVNGFTASAATISNDTLIITGSVASLLLAARAAASPRSWPALLAGAAAGAVFVGKSTGLGLFPLAALVVLALHRAGGAVTERWVRRVLAAGLGAGAVTLPWIAWNLTTYDAISAADAVDAITGNLQSVIEPGIDALRRHWTGARVSFWESGLLTADASYRRSWDLIALILGVSGLGAALRRWRQGEALPLAALNLSFAVAFATLIAFFFLVLGGSGLLLGRYLFVALVPLLLGLGASALALVGPRWAPTLVLAIGSFVLWQEIDLTDRYQATTYEETSLDPSLAPVVDQSWNDGLVRADAVVVDAGCPVEVLQLGLEHPPATITVQSDAGEVAGRRVANLHTSFATYELAAAAGGQLRIAVPAGTGVAVSAADLEPRAELVGGDADPLVRAWCRLGSEEAARMRFEHTFDPQHLDLDRDLLRAWPRVWFAAALVATVAALAVALRRRSTTTPR